MTLWEAGRRFAPPDPLLDSYVKSQEFSNYKVVKTGKLIEVYRSQYPFRTGDLPERDALEPIDRKNEYKKRGGWRAKNKIRRLVQTNFDKQSKFITLTFADSDKLDITDLSACYTEFNKFIMRLRYKYPGVKYVAVPEFQTTNDRGAVHYHIICDIPFIKSSILAHLWGNGFVKINRISYSKKIGLYVSKYITKQAVSEAFESRKKYYRSRNLSEPTTFYGTKAKVLYTLLFREHIERIEYQTTYNTEFNGKMVYTEFNFYSEGG